MDSFRDTGSQYIPMVKVPYCTVPSIGKQLLTSDNSSGLGLKLTTLEEGDKLEC